MGGEEFSVFLPGIASDRAVVVAERIRETVKAAEFCFEGVSCDLSISIGATAAILDRPAELTVARSDWR